MGDHASQCGRPGNIEGLDRMALLSSRTQSTALYHRVMPPEAPPLAPGRLLPCTSRQPNVWPMAYERPAMSVERLLACGHRRRETEQLLIVPTEGAHSGRSPSRQALAEQPARRSPLTRASRRGQTKRRRTSWTSSTHPRRFPTTDTGSVSAWTRAGPATAATSRIRCSTAGVTSMQ